MPDTTTTRRPIADSDLDWVLEHEREIQDFRLSLLARDGHILDTTTREVVELAQTETAS